jgi:glycosyltransferase involved in cell wall biosynthesis
MPKTIWEQFALPWYARKLGAQAIYSHSECAPFWGPPVLLHVPEDPYQRWQGSPATTTKEHVRRSYQRLTVRRSLFRARPLVTSCDAIADELQHRFGADLKVSAIVALGVDAEIFHPDGARPREDAVFHLGSIDARDQTPLVVAAYAKAVKVRPDLPELLIAGRLGQREALVLAAAEHHGVANRVQLLGYISDEELRQRYAHSALCLQPARYEGFGLQPLEALACGAALVVFPEPAVKEVVADAALVAPTMTEGALADAILKLWADAPLRSSLREAGPKRAAPFTWAATAAGLHELLLSAVNGGLDPNMPRKQFGLLRTRS